MERSRTDQGMALLAVVAVLVALVLIATPFALQMQSAADRSQNLLYSEQADQEAQQIFTLIALYATNGVEEVEREAAGKLDDEEENIPLFATPDYDTLEEFGLPAEELARFNSNSARGRIWDVRVEDEQAKFNLNSVPWQVLGNLFGATTLTRELEEDDDDVRLADVSMLPAKNGVIRIGTEMIYYEELDGGRLSGVQRGYQADKPWNTGPKQWKPGETVVPASAFEIATLPIRIDEKGYQAYSNVFQAKRIVEMGTAAIDPDTFDRYAEYLTCWSGRDVAGGWCNSQVVRNSLPSGSSDEGGDYLVLDDPTYYGPGTIVRVRSGEHTEYGIVLSNNGRQINLGSSFRNDYQMGEARVEMLARHPVNVNTASDAVLIACLANVRLRISPSQDVMTFEKAQALLPRLRAEPIKSLKQYKEILQQAQTDNIIAQSDYYALYLNALNPGHWELGFSTVPFCFKSWDTYTVKATAVVNSKTGEEIARKTLRRVISVSPRRSAVSVLESQEDFEAQIIASRDAKYMMTFPGNTGGQYQGRTVPPSRFTAHIIRNIWPSDSRMSGLGDVRLQPERLGLARVFHYDESHYADGYYIQGSALTYDTRNENIGLAESDGTMRPLAASFWYKPFWGGVGSTQMLMDTGEDTWTNRVAVFYDGTTQEVVFRVADATLEDRAVEVRYAADSDQMIDETWYHVGVSAPGTKPGDLTLLIDGQSVGDATYLSRLSQSIPATGEVAEIYLEDASSFPESGAVILRGVDGSEIFEYEGRSQGSLTVTKRYAREPIAVVQSDSYEGHAFAEGTIVTLLGYSSPLLTDIPVGGSSLLKDLGAFHCLKVLFTEDRVYITEGTPGGGGGDLGTGGEPPPGITIQDPGAGLDPGGGGGGASGSIEVLGIASDRESLTLKLGDTLKAWDDGASDADAFTAFGESGFALLVSPQITLGAEQSADEVIGGWEIVTYEKSGQNLNVRRYAATRQIEAAPFHFVPAHTYGSEDATIDVDMGGTATTGVATALIPISVEGTSGGDYFDVTEDSELTVPALALQRVFCSVGTEWFAYTYPDEETSAGKTLFVHDRPGDINSVVALFGAGTVTTSAIGSGDGDMGDQPIDPGDLPPDDDPPPEPPAPPPPGPGDLPPGDDDGGPGGGSPPPVDPGDSDDDGGPSGNPSPPPDGGPPPGDDDGGPSGNPSPFPEDPGTAPGDNDGGPSGDPSPPPDTGLPPGDDDGGPGSGGGGGGGDSSSRRASGWRRRGRGRCSSLRRRR